LSTPQVDTIRYSGTYMDSTPQGVKCAYVCVCVCNTYMSSKYRLLLIIKNAQEIRVCVSHTDCTCVCTYWPLCQSLGMFTEAKVFKLF